MNQVTVTHLHGEVYDVSVRDADGSSSSHTVSVWPSDIQRYAPDATPEALIEASFTFLLEREPKESILARFELPVIERYFPDYPARIQMMLDDTGSDR